jgi:hypothetical protein
MTEPNYEQCPNCKEWYPYPVGYHHNEEECEYNRVVSVLDYIANHSGDDDPPMVAQLNRCISHAKAVLKTINRNR